MKTFPPFEQIKEQAAQYVQRKAQTDLVAGLHKDAKIERPDEPAAAASPQATPATPAK